MAETMSKPFFVRIPNRGQVRITGGDRMAFLQNLATNDLRLLERQPAIYSCLLSPQGKFMHDYFVRQERDALVLECEGGARAEDLMKKMKPFKLRSQVELSFEPDVPVYAVFGVQAGYPDPRHPEMGFRSHEKPHRAIERYFAAWDEHRIRLGIPDGSRDMEVEKDTVLECNIDRLNGVSFEKGCYVGQEITSRMHLRGLVKSHLHPVMWGGPAPAPFSDIKIGGQLAGQMRSSRGALGLALLRDDHLDLLRKPDGPLQLI
jgi:tRNA-modifying protein YgfZ